MTTENYKVRDVQPTVLRLNPDLRARLVKDAKAHGRSLSKEIEVLLQQALGETGPSAREPGASYQVAAQRADLSDTETALLRAFRKLAPEKQLGLLSLIR